MLIFIDVRHRLDDAEVLDLLKLAIGYPTPEKLASVAYSYRAETGRFAFGLQVENRLVGVIAGDMRLDRSATIGHIAVRPDQRRQGFGAQLIANLRNRLSLQEIVAETDRDAVEFYRGCGFEVASLPSPYAGVERFRCRWYEGAQ